MVAACRKKYPNVRFETMDARSMPQFPDASFELIVFAWAGICIVDLVRRGTGFCLHTALRIYNRNRYKKRGISTQEYSVINDKCHDYKTLLYYITLEQQREQLRRVGFKPGLRVYNSKGGIVEHDDGNLGDSLLFVVER